MQEAEQKNGGRKTCSQRAGKKIHYKRVNGRNTELKARRFKKITK
jgi:hypothetical protein